MTSQLQHGGVLEQPHEVLRSVLANLVVTDVELRHLGRVHAQYSMLDSNRALHTLDTCGVCMRST